MAHSTRDDAGRGTWQREQSTVVRQAQGKPGGVSPSVVIFAESEVPSEPTEWAPHTHPLHELLWVRGGTLTARIGNRVFTVSEGNALWIPAEAVHSGRLTAKVEFSDAFFDPVRSPVAFDKPTAIAMTPVLESLLVHLARTDLDAPARARAEAVVFDVLEPSEHELALLLPGDARIDVIAQAFLDDPADDRGLEDWARRLDLSERTIARAFRSSTGLSFVQWRRALRIQRALTLLAEGYDVCATSELLGYAQSSTFIAAFRRVMGTTPGAFIAAQRVERPVRNAASVVASGRLQTPRRAPILDIAKARQT